MTSSNKEKQQRHRQLERVKSKLAKQQLEDDAPDTPKFPRDEAQRQALVEQRIQEAMANGLFENLPGQGQPLPLQSNPYLEPGQEMAFGLLKNNDFAPDWIERDKEIRRELTEARSRLRAAWQQYQGNPTGESAWQAAVARFEARLNVLNRKIGDFNLVVPIISKQRLPLRLATELNRLKEESQ